MNNKGITLLELIIVLIIIAVLVLAIAYEFIALSSLQSGILGQINASDNARMVMSQMVRVLRYADPATVSYQEHMFTNYVTSITANIKGGHLNGIATDTWVMFDRTADNIFEYHVGGSLVGGVWYGGSAYVISKNITDFSNLGVDWTVDPTGGTLWLKITAVDPGSNKTSSIESRVHPLGG